MSGYDADILEWSSQQAALLRRLASGERLNDPPDWTNIIDEVEAVGRSELRAVEGLLTQALLHRLKAEAWPESRDAPHWRREAEAFLSDARADCTPSMRGKIDLARLHARELGHLPDWMGDLPAQPVPETCPVTLDELLA